MLLSFDEWLPDQPTLLAGCTEALNVLPGPSAYLPMPSLVPYTTAVGGKVLGGIIAQSSGNSYNYCGDKSALYSLANQSFTSVTRVVGGAYNVLGDDYWEFANWGNTVIGVNGHNDLPQQISLGAANFVDMSVGVKASHIAVVKDFVVLGNVSDSAAQVSRLRWCAINNPLDFVPSPATLADYQDLPTEYGPIQRVVGGGYGVVFQSKAITRMDFVGSPLVFAITTLHTNIGAFSPRAVTNYQNLVFFLAEDGFYTFDGSSLNPIGRGKVDSFFYKDLDKNHTVGVVAGIDPINKIVLWAYPSINNKGGNLDSLLIYSWAYNKWTHATGLDLEMVLSSVTTGINLDNLTSTTGFNLDALPVSLDSVQWTGGSIILSAYDKNHVLGRFNGAPMNATLRTREYQHFAGHRALTTEVWPYAVGLSASATLTLLNRDTLTRSMSAIETSVVNDIGYAPFLSDTRYSTIQLDVAGGFDQILGVNVEATQTGGV